MKLCVTPTVARCHQTKHLIVQNLQRLPETNELFYTDVSTDGGEVLRALVDSGSMACTVSETADSKLSQSIQNIEKRSAEDFIIVGCGGHPVTPSAIYDLTVSVYGYKSDHPCFSCARSSR